MSRLTTVLSAVAVLIAGAMGPALADTIIVGSLALNDLWTRATPPGAPTAAGYLTIANNGAEADRLIAVASPYAETGEIHVMEMKDGVMSMRAVEGGIEIPAGGSVTLAPGGLHLMFIKLKDALHEGDELPVRLTFEKAGSVETSLHVMAIGAKGPSAETMDGMDHGAAAK